MASSPLHFLTSGEGHRHLQEGKQRTIQLIQFFLVFQIFAPLPSLLDLPRCRSAFFGFHLWRMS